MSFFVGVQSLIIPTYSEPNFSLRYIRTLPVNSRIHFPSLGASRSRVSSNYTQDASDLVDDRRSWSRAISSNYDEEDDDDEEEEEEEEGDDRSLDLFVRFVHNVFRKVSKKTREAVRSVLPLSIPTKLVGFSVNGILVLVFLWVLKAFLEVVCTVGSMVFVSILLIRGIWSGVSYVQESRQEKVDDLWSGIQPVT